MHAVSASSLQLKSDSGPLFEDDSPLKVTETRSNDPFYLDVDANSGSSTGATLVHQSGKFGSIQLTDSNEESGTRRKKKRERKRKEKKKRNSSILPQSGVLGSTSEFSQAAMGKCTGQHFTVYRSDDDDDEEEEERMLTKMPGDKEFEGLRKIDLSAATATVEEEKEVSPTPVLPNDFPERIDAAKVKKTGKKKGGDREKSKKKKKKPKKKSKDHRLNYGDTMDLLDLGGGP